MARPCRHGRRRFALPALLALFALFMVVPARGQVNVEAVRKQLEFKDFGARLRFSMAAYAGNTEGIVFGTTGLIGFRSERNLFFGTASSDYARLGGATTVQKSFLHLRHNHQFTDIFWWEEFAQSETDKFRRIQFRGLLGTGPRFKVFSDKEWLDLFVGHSYMLEYTSVDESTIRTSPAVAHRFNNYVAITARPDERIILSSILYYQPRFDNWYDWRLLNVSSVEFKVTTLLATRMDATTRYESRPALGVKSADLEFKSSLELKF